MDNNGRNRKSFDGTAYYNYRTADDDSLPPWLFRHNDLIRNMTFVDYIDKKKLTNIINFIHFKGDHLHALLNHPRYKEEILVKIHPEPCLGDELVCHWDHAHREYKLERYRFKCLIISHDQSIILSPASILRSGHDGLIVQLPDSSPVTNKRQIPRFKCENINAELLQNGFQAKGILVDFSPYALRVRFQAVPFASFYWFDPDMPATLTLFNGNDVYYSGNCRHRYKQQNGYEIDMVLTPMEIQSCQYKTKKIMYPCKQNLPPLLAIFNHPLTKKTFQREIFKISTSGFLIRDKTNDAVLMPGMIIPKMTICYAGLLKINCKTQVIYRNDEVSSHFEMIILDMGIKEYNKLNQLLNNLPGIDDDMANEVDPDQLWELLFFSNFIYPTKYQHIQAFRKDFQITYQKLYKECPEIAKHFTYQKNGQIYSHISLLRAYERSWMVHHHAARPMDGIHTGLIVLKKMIAYLFDLKRLPSAMLDYFICYFQSENKFTDRIYTQFAKQKSDQVCSLDLFSYLTHTVSNASSPMPPNWSLQKCSTSDLWELEQFYKHHSGGLLMDVLDLKNSHHHTLENIYEQQGLHRKWQAVALYFSGELKAVIIKEESDVAINLSDLLNGFKIFIMDNNIPLKIIFMAVENISRIMSIQTYPLLVYPSEYIKQAAPEFEKHYMLWILDARHANEFLEYMMKRFRMKFS